MVSIPSLIRNEETRELARKKLWMRLEMMYVMVVLHPAIVVFGHNTRVYYFADTRWSWSVPSFLVQSTCVVTSMEDANRTWLRAW